MSNETPEPWAVVEDPWEGSKTIALFESKEAAENAVKKLQEVNYDEYRDLQIHRQKIFGMDIEPQHRLILQARINDTMQIIPQGEVAQLYFPWDMTFYPVTWSWRRENPELFDYGVLTVDGFDKEQVRELFQILSEEYRVTDELRKMKRAGHGRS